MPRRIDHLVLAVNDLDAAASFYEALGFIVGARNRHPWGTENRIVQFTSSFLELITIGEGAQIPPHEPGQFSFGAFVRDYLEKGEGLAMLVLDSNDARADAVHFSKSGLGAYAPFYFERKGQRPDGRETHVAFTLAFATDVNLPNAGFFVCQQHFPNAFWNPELQAHPNGASNIVGVDIGATAPPRHVGFLSEFAGSSIDDTLRVSLECEGTITLCKSQTEGLIGFTIAVPDLTGIRASLKAAGLACTESARELTLEAHAGRGVAIRFALC